MIFDLLYLYKKQPAGLRGAEGITVDSKLTQSTLKAILIPSSHRIQPTNHILDARNRISDYPRTSGPFPAFS